MCRLADPRQFRGRSYRQSPSEALLMDRFHLAGRYIGPGRVRAGLDEGTLARLCGLNRTRRLGAAIRSLYINTSIHMYFQEKVPPIVRPLSFFTTRGI